MARIDNLFARMLELQASDLHLRSGATPRFRVRGELLEDPGRPPLSAVILDQLLRQLLTAEQAEHYERRGSIDFAYGNPALGRYRCSLFNDHRGPAAVFRTIRNSVPTLAELGLPPEIEDFAHLRHGLVLVAGPTGSGKTATLAAIVDTINANDDRHIITLEDPIEYLHVPKRSIVHQRGLHYDFTDFCTAIAEAPQQDADVLVVGELRDLDSVTQAMRAAELGMLVFVTLHTTCVVDSIHRLVDVFPAGEQSLVRAQLAQTLAGALTQVLVPRADGAGRVPATEVLRATPQVATIIRESRTLDLTAVLAAGRSQGMHTRDDALLALAGRGTIAPGTALQYATNKDEVERSLRRETLADAK